MMKLRVFLCAPALLMGLSTLAVATKPVNEIQKTVFIKADDGFDTDITAAIEKKHTPLTVVMDSEKADYTLVASTVAQHAESTGSKVARCLFIDCIGMEGNSAVSVRLMDRENGTVIWAYQVRKGTSGPMARQSLSEAIAKHLKQYLDAQTKKTT